MATIKAVTRYPYKGKEYKSLEELKDAVQNTIGEEVIDKINKKIEIRHKDLFVLLEILYSKEVRKVLTECLNVKVGQYDEELCELEPLNVLDVK